MNDKLSLTELQLIIKDSIYVSLPGMYWVIAEIAEMKENNSGHCYLELVEKDPDEINIRSRVRAVIWSKKHNFLKSFFENTTGESLRVGLKVLIKVIVEYHEIYGLSLVINDIDPAFTMGEMAIRRQQIIKRLEKEGVLTMNKEHIFPMLPKNIAVISSRNAAGYSDFLKHLTGNSFGYVFNIHLFEASMQGTETEASIIDALDRISDVSELFDVVAIIRGGGSQFDLSWFDNYNIAYHITQFPLPVLTGIGHEKDFSVTDIVAYESLKTPTAVADFLIDTFAETENYLTETSRTISELASSIIKINREQLDRSMMRLIPLTSNRINSEKEKLSKNIFAVINLGKQYIMKEEAVPVSLQSRIRLASGHLLCDNAGKVERFVENIQGQSFDMIKQWSKQLNYLGKDLTLINPDNVLKRGYTISSMNGTILKSSKMIKEGDEIQTRFSDGTVRSIVEGE
jgi:exodeoxyribonuclease VII large subunit